MILKEEFQSKLDRTRKFLFVSGAQVLEVSYIDHFDDKDSICVPTQTMCNMACKFCHTTEALGKVPVVNLTHEQITSTVQTAYDRLELAKNSRTLLVSFMGCGEPLENIPEVLQTMRVLTSMYQGKVPLIRFGLATSLPRAHSGKFVSLGEAVKRDATPLKVHLSLHYTTEELRRHWMPRAESIMPSVNLLEWYKNYTGNPVEVHYTLIDGVNDTDDDACRLGVMLRGRGIEVKLLRFNPKAGEPYQPTPAERVKEFERLLGDEFGVVSECYTPPGADIGASCGQFLMDYYIKHANGQ